MAGVVLDQAGLLAFVTGLLDELKAVLPNRPVILAAVSLLEAWLPVILSILYSRMVGRGKILAPLIAALCGLALTGCRCYAQDSPDRAVISARVRLAVESQAQTSSRTRTVTRTRSVGPVEPAAAVEILVPDPDCPDGKCPWRRQTVTVERTTRESVTPLVPSYVPVTPVYVPVTPVYVVPGRPRLFPRIGMGNPATEAGRAVETAGLAWASAA